MVCHARKTGSEEPAALTQGNSYFTALYSKVSHCRHECQTEHLNLKIVKTLRFDSYDQNTAYRDIVMMRVGITKRCVF